MPISPRSTLALLLMTGSAVGLRAQKPIRTSTETDLSRDPSGIPLLHLPKGTPVTLGSTRNGWVEATVQGWIAGTALHDDKRDGFDVSVTPSAGTALREKPNGGALLATARLGALFDRMDTQNGWVHVKRTGWVPVPAVTAVAAPAPPATPHAASPPAAPPPLTAPAAAPAVPNATVAAGSAMSFLPGGPPFTTIEAPVSGPIVERRSGWTHVRIDAWVPDAAIGNLPVPGGITAADIRAAPDKYIGQTVEWTIEVLGIETADELRPEMPEGQPYLLARGPLPETGFVYVVITKDDVDAFRRLQPLAKIRIRATIRAGKSRFLPTPVLNLVRRLD